MLRERGALILKVHKLLDVFLSVLAFAGAYFIEKYLLHGPLGGLSSPQEYYLLMLMIIIIWYTTFSLFYLYASYRTRSLPQIILSMIKAVSVASLFLILLMYLFKIGNVSRIMMGIFYLLNIGILAISKGIVQKILSHFRKKGFNFRNVLIIGSRDRAHDLIKCIVDHLGAGFRVLGCLDLEPKEVGKKLSDGVEVIGTVDQLEKILCEQVVDELVFAMPLNKISKVNSHISLAEKIGTGVRVIPDWQIQRLRYNPQIATMHFEDFLGIPTMTFTTTPAMQGALLVKNAADYILGSLMILFFLPAFLIIACGIKLCSAGPVLYRQERLGLNGRSFAVYKFRTMVKDSDTRREELNALNEADGPVFKIKNDPRVVPFIGTFLRKTSLDELPQLINVIRGEMSLVGPRPPIPTEVKQYRLRDRRRLSMKPGLTCLWQIAHKRNDVKFEEWMKLDLAYIDNWSLWLDLKILFRTFWVVVMGEGS